MSHHQGQDTSSTNKINGQEDNTTHQEEQEKFQRVLPGDPIPQPGKYLLKQLAMLCIMLVFDLGIPLALYYGLRDKIGLLYSLIIAGIPPVLWVIYKLVWKRVIDALGVILSLSFILSGVISLVSGDARAAILRDSAVASIVGGLFLITLIPIKTKWFVNRPLTYIMAQSMFSEAEYVWIDREGNIKRQNVVEFQWDVVRYFRISMYTQTAAWGIILILELVACVIMIKSNLDTSRIVDINNIISNIVIGVMVPLSVLAAAYGRRVEKRVGIAWAKENDFTAKYRPEYANENERCEEAV